MMGLSAMDKLQHQRFELKYIVSEATALKVREFVRSYLDLDENGENQPNLSYPVHSLYMDSEELKLYWETINGDKNRYKLRLRYYSLEPTVPVFFEIKRRMNNCILKQRGAVRQDAVTPLLTGHPLCHEHMASSNPKDFMAVQKFCDLMHSLQARPKVHIFYMREAYVSPDGEVRVTMDRDVCGDPNPEPRIKIKMEHPVRAFGDQVILELKFTNRFPQWFNHMVRAFHVMQCGAAKYVESMALIAEPDPSKNPKWKMANTME
jgi:hypothetical protein